MPYDLASEASSPKTIAVLFYTWINAKAECSKGKVKRPNRKGLCFYELVTELSFLEGGSGELLQGAWHSLAIVCQQLCKFRKVMLSMVSQFVLPISSALSGDVCADSTKICHSKCIKLFT